MRITALNALSKSISAAALKPDTKSDVDTALSQATKSMEITAPIDCTKSKSDTALNTTEIEDGRTI